MQKLSAHEFIEKIKNATTWMVGKDTLTNALILACREGHKNTQYFTGPDPLHMTELEYQVFLNQVKDLIWETDDNPWHSQNSPSTRVTRSRDSATGRFSKEE